MIVVWCSIVTVLKSPVLHLVKCLISVFLSGTWNAGSSSRTFPYPIHGSLLSRSGESDHQAGTRSWELQPRPPPASRGPHVHNHPGSHGRHHQLQQQPRSWDREQPSLQRPHENGVQTGRHPHGWHPFSCWHNWSTSFLGVPRSIQNQQPKEQHEHGGNRARLLADSPRSAFSQTASFLDQQI